MALPLGGSGANTEPPQKPFTRPDVQVVGPETADFQPGRDKDAQGTASPVKKG